MAELPYAYININDAIARAVHMSPEQRGAYWSIYWVMWRAGGLYPDNEGELAQIAGCTRKRWVRMAPVVRRGMTMVEGQISYPELLELRDQTQAMRKVKSEAAKEGWARRKSLTNQESTHAGAYADALRNGRNQNQNPSTITSLTRSAKGQAMGELFEFGAQSLVKRGGLSYNKAKKRLENWLGCIENDADILRVIIFSAERLPHLKGPAFSEFIAKQVQEHVQRLAPRLPFRPHKASG